MQADDVDIAVIRQMLTSRPRPVGWPARRQRLDEIGSVWGWANDVKLTAVDIGGIAGEWSVAPDSRDRRALMFFHGGGFCSGSILSHRSLVTAAGRAAGVRTLAVGYRLAPENPFPAALEDAIKSWRFLRKQGYEANQIAVGGDSAGGGLTAALIYQLSQEGEELPACAWMISPWTDLTMSGQTMLTKDLVDPLIHKAYLEELASAAIPRGVDRKDPRVSPLYADLRGFPPVLVQVGSHETLLTDSTRFASAAAAADVAVTLEVWPGMIHAWPLWNARLEPGRKAIENAARFLREHLRVRDGGSR